MPWSVLEIVITGKKSAVDAGFTIGLTTNTELMPIGGVSTSTKGVVEGKIGEALTWARVGEAGDVDDKANGAGANEIAIGGGLEGEFDVKILNFRGFLAKLGSKS